MIRKSRTRLITVLLFGKAKVKLEYQDAPNNETCMSCARDNCRGAMDNKELVPWCRRGLLAYVYNGVSD